jgi:integrase/recombinase XerD
MDWAKGSNSCFPFTPATYPPFPSGDLNYKRCRCPKWINGRLGSDGSFIRRSGSWEKAEDFKRKLEDEYEAKQKGLEEVTRPEPAVLTVKDAVARFLNSKRNENLADSTLDKLTTIFEKQFLGWDRHHGYTRLLSNRPNRDGCAATTSPCPLEHHHR